MGRPTHRRDHESGRTLEVGAGQDECGTPLAWMELRVCGQN